MFDEPTFLIQVGHNGKNRVHEAIDRNHLGGAILSPTDYKPEKNSIIANSLKDEDLITLFDPHFYLPGQGDRKDLDEYDYHNQFGGEAFSSSLFFDANARSKFAELVIDEQDELNTDAYISPAPYLSDLSYDEVDDWCDLIEGFIEVASDYGRDIPIFVSLPINGDRLSDDDLRNNLLNSATQFDVEGFYVSTSYSDKEKRLPLHGEEALRPYLDVMSTLRINRYELIAGHTHQIAHFLLPIGINAIASGHYKNLRNFDHERWIVPEGTQIRRTVIRYYSDELLTSIRPDGLLDELAKNKSFDLDLIRTQSPYETGLFDDAVTPANAGWGQAEGSWDHYTWACDNIVSSYRGKDLEERADIAQNKISRAKALYNQISTNIGEHVDEINPEFYDDWKTVLTDFRGSPEFQRLKRLS